MGISFLSSYVEKNSDVCSESILLTEKAAKTNERVKLVVDGWSFVHDCMDDVAAEGQVKGWEWALGGEYQPFHERMTSRVQELQKGGVDLIVCFDPPKGTDSAEAEKRKHFTTLARLEKKTEGVGRALMMLSGGLHALRQWERSEGIAKIWQLPPATGWQAQRTLASLGVECITLDQEADGELVKLMERRGALAVVGRDSDFFCIDGSRYIPWSYLSVDEGQVSAQLFTPELVAKSLQIPTRRMHELAFLSGNDINNHLVANVAKQLGVLGKSMNSRLGGMKPLVAAEFLKTLDQDACLSTHHGLAALISSNPEVAAAWTKSKEFYQNTGREALDGNDELEREIMNAVRTGAAPAWALGIVRHGTISCSYHVEPILAGKASSVSMSTRPLRQAVYSLLNRRVEGVVEFMSSGLNRFEERVKGHDKVREVIGADDLLSIWTWPETRRLSAFVGLVEMACSDGWEEGSSRLAEAVMLVSSPTTTPWTIFDVTPAPAQNPVSIHVGPLGQPFPMQEVARVLRFTVASSRRTLRYGHAEAEAAGRCCLLLHSGVNPLLLPERDISPRAATFAALLLDCAEWLHSVSSLLRSVPQSHEPRSLFSGRLFAHALANTREIQELCKQLGITEDMVRATCVGVPREASDNSPDKSSPPMEASMSLELGGDSQLLPIEAFRESILEQINESRVTTIHGETGCGKSSMVPLFLVQDAMKRGVKVKVVVAQPRRIAAISLAKRVAGIIGEDTGGLVGFKVGYGVSNVSQKTVVTYVTVGWLLQFFSHNPDALESYTHVVLDEVHERSLDVDLLCLMLKKLVEKLDERGGTHGPKLIVMSATLQAKLFGGYFLGKGGIDQQKKLLLEQGLALNGASGEEADDTEAIEVDEARPVEAVEEEEQLGEYSVSFGGENASIHAAGLPPSAVNAEEGVSLERVMRDIWSPEHSTEVDEKNTEGGAGAEESQEEQLGGSLGSVTEDPSGEGVKPIFVGAKRFPVRVIYMEDVDEAYPGLASTCGWFFRKQARHLDVISGNSGKEKSGREDVNFKEWLSLDMRRAVSELVCEMAQKGSCILIFLPGLAEISDMYDALEATRTKVPLQVLMLHSLVPDDEQAQALGATRAGHCKVILSTNIAETSLTIPNVSNVIDMGLHREVSYDEKRRLQVLVIRWVSSASAQQRAGRAGRVSPGTVVRLYTKAFHERRMPEFDDPEILRTPLERTILRMKLMMPSSRGFGTVSSLLNETLTPPSERRVKTAVRVLYERGALEKNDEQAEVTELGRVAVYLPIDLKLVKLIYLGHAFGCLNESIVMATALSYGDVFSQPSQAFIRGTIDYATALHHSLSGRVAADRGQYSEPLAYLTVYKAWLASAKTDFVARRLSVNRERMNTLRIQVAHVCDQFQMIMDVRENGVDGFGTGFPRLQVREPEWAGKARLATLKAESLMTDRGQVSKKIESFLGTQDEVLKVVLFGSSVPEVFESKASAGRSGKGIPVVDSEDKLTKEQEMRTVAFTIDVKRHRTESIVRAFMNALGLKLEKIHIAEGNSKRSRQIYVRFQEPTSTPSLEFPQPHPVASATPLPPNNDPWSYEKANRDLASRRRGRMCNTGDSATVDGEGVEEVQVQYGGDISYDAKLLMQVAGGTGRSEDMISLPWEVISAHGGKLAEEPKEIVSQLKQETKSAMWVMRLDELDPDDVVELLAEEDNSDNGKENDLVSIRHIKTGARLHWRFTSSLNEVFVNRRSPLALMSDALLKKSEKRLCVATSLIGGAGSSVQATGVTVMPRGFFGNIQYLMFAPRDSKISLQMSPSGHIIGYKMILPYSQMSESKIEVKKNREKEFKKSLSKVVVDLRPHFLTTADIGLINQVRQAISISIERGALGAYDLINSERMNGETLLDQLMSFCNRKVPTIELQNLAGSATNEMTEEEEEQQKEKERENLILKEVEESGAEFVSFEESMNYTRMRVEELRKEGEESADKASVPENEGELWQDCFLENQTDDRGIAAYLPAIKLCPNLSSQHAPDDRVAAQDMLDREVQGGSDKAKKRRSERTGMTATSTWLDEPYNDEKLPTKQEERLILLVRSFWPDSISLHSLKEKFESLYGTRFNFRGLQCSSADDIQQIRDEMKAYANDLYIVHDPKSGKPVSIASISQPLNGEARAVIRALRRRKKKLRLEDWANVSKLNWGPRDRAGRDIDVQRLDWSPEQWLLYHKQANDAQMLIREEGGEGSKLNEGTSQLECGISRSNFMKRLNKYYGMHVHGHSSSDGQETVEESRGKSGFSTSQNFFQSLYRDGWIDICWIANLDPISGMKFHRSRVVVGPKKLHKDGLEHTPLPELFSAMKNPKGTGSPAKGLGCFGPEGMMLLPWANARMWGGREKDPQEEHFRCRGVVFGALAKSVNGSWSWRLPRQRGGVSFRSSKRPGLGRKAQLNGVVIGAVRAMRAAARLGR